MANSANGGAGFNYDTKDGAIKYFKAESDRLRAALVLAEAWESGKNVGPVTGDEVLRRIREALRGEAGNNC